MKKFIPGFLIIFLLMANQAFAADQMAATEKGNREGDQAMLIRVERDHLSVKLREAPIKAVLEEIGRHTGIEIVILVPLTQYISMEFKDLPLEEGLRRILKDHGWSLVTAGKDNNVLEKVFVVSRGGKTHLVQQPGSSPPRQDKKAHPVAVLANKKEIQHYFDVLFDNPGSLASMQAFTQVSNALSAEEIEPIIEMLEDDDFQPSEWEAALSGVNENMRNRIVMNLRNLDIRAEAIGKLKQIQKLKMEQ